MGEIVVEVHDPDDQPRSERFIGRWLVRPNTDQTRPEEPGYQEYRGVALTRRGQIAVYNAHPEGAWAELAVCASLDAAKRSNCVPGVVGLFIWTRIDDQRQRSFVTGYPGRPPGIQDHEDIRGSMHVGRR